MCDRQLNEEYEVHHSNTNTNGNGQSNTSGNK